MLITPLTAAQQTLATVCLQSILESVQVIDFLEPSHVACTHVMT
jgi:hypothetical protein